MLSKFPRLVRSSPFLVFSLLSSLFPLAARAAWGELQVPLTQVRTIEFSSNGSVGLVAGSGQTNNIFRSTDGGKTWIAPSQNPVGSATMKDISFVPNSTTGWVVGFGDVIAKTTDGGVTFIDQSGFTLGQNVNAVYAIDSMTAVVVGAQGVFLTKNGGSSWPQVYASPVELTDVMCRGVNTCWTVGLQGKVYFTNNLSDANPTWTLKNVGGTMEDLNGIDLSSDNAAWLIVGKNRTLLRSIDGGSMWNPVSVADSVVPATTALNSVRFNTAEGSPEAVIAASNGNVLVTSNYGASWQNVALVTWTGLNDDAYMKSTNDIFVAMTGAGANKLLRYDIVAPPAPGNLRLSTGGTITNDTTPTFLWDASVDTQTPIESYAVQDLAVFLSSSTLTYTAGTLAQGPQTFNVQAKDSASNFSTKVTLNYTIDTTAPTVGTASPSTATANQATTFSASYSDASGVSSCSLLVDSADKGTMTLSNGTASKAYTFTANGTYSVQTKCTDVAGNMTTGSPVSVIVTGAAPPPSDTTPSSNTSLVSANPTSVQADNVSVSTITVTVKNAGGAALAGKTVILASSRGSLDTISPATAQTNSSGVATFTVKSASLGSPVLTAKVDNINVGSALISFDPIVTPPTPTPTSTPPTPACQTPVVPIGSLVKLPDDGNPATQEDSAVYYYGADCKRHAFPNAQAYFTWYTDFSAVKIIDLTKLASMPLGNNVTYRPGVKMVKFTTVPKVYAVGKNGVLRWVKTEQVAIALYSSDWNKKIDDISDAFYINYTFGADINSISDFNISNEMSAAQTIDQSL